MIEIHKFAFKSLVLSTLLACAFSQPARATVEVGGVKFEDADKVAGNDLKLNGAGMRTKFVFKVYAAGLYLPERKTALADILKLEGARRVTLVMVRDVPSRDLSDGFMDGLNQNLGPAEKAALALHIGKFSQLFATVPGVKKGDVLHLDWIPGTGTHIELNGKKLGDTVPDLAFYNAVLRIWLGENPVDRSLKPALLGETK